MKSQNPSLTPLGPMCRALFTSLICGLAASAPALGAETQAPEPGQVIGYAKADRSGGSQAWALPPDKPYLYVPAIPAHLGGKLAAVNTGFEVGAILFQGPYFTSRDSGCQPALGTATQPEKPWLGATAHFEPAPGGHDQRQGQDAKESGFASMILYRTDLGPPPGVLLMERRATAGLRCDNSVHATLYNRIFVPVAEAPSYARCFELVGNYPGTEGDFALDFLGTSRAVLLLPGDMSARYAGIRHDFTVSVFDGLACEGRAMTLTSRAGLDRDRRLSQAGFRGQTRSVRLTYNRGNAEAFLARQEAPQLGPGTGGAAVAAAGTPERDAAVNTDREPASTISPETTPETTPEMAPEKAARKAPAVTPVVAATRTEPSPGATSGTPPAATAMSEAKPAPAVAVASMSTPNPPKKADLSKAMPKQVPKTPLELKAEPIAAGLGGGLGALEPKAAAIAAAPQIKTARTFAYPVQDIYRLNHCLFPGKDCGAAAANTWCQAKGFAEAVDWSVDEGIGAMFPTLLLGEKKICARDSCDGFKAITCGP